MTALVGVGPNVQITESEDVSHAVAVRGRPSWSRTSARRTFFKLRIFDESCGGYPTATNNVVLPTEKFGRARKKKVIKQELSPLEQKLLLALLQLCYGGIVDVSNIKQLDPKNLIFATKNQPMTSFIY